MCKSILKTIGLVVMLLPSLALGQQVCQSAISPSTPTTQFVVHEQTDQQGMPDGTVTDTRTGLMWQRCLLGQLWHDGGCGGEAVAFTWAGAMQAVEAINAEGGFADFTDWRLPNMNELESIVELQCVAPAINTEIFSDRYTGYIWSASPSADYSYYAWYVDFYSGYANYSYLRAYYYRVRLVRGGQ